MKIVKVRSPFIITVAETGQIGSKIELSIWNKGNAVPSSGAGFYSLSKSVPSATQINTSYNISNYVKEFIENVKPNNYDLNPGIDIYADNVYEWVNFKVKRYKLVGSTYTLLDSTDYVGVNGFTNYLDGYQTATDSVFTLLGNTNINFNYYKKTYTDLKMEYVNLLIDRPATTTTSVKYERIDGGTYTFTTNFLIGQIGIYNMKIPITPIIYDGNFINGCKVTVTSTPSSGTPEVYVFYTYPIEECKYTPVRCSFINRYGGWKDIIFFKAQSNSISVKGTDYKLTQSAINYNTSIGQFKTFNTNGKQTTKLNTGWVDENYSELITDLLLSETVLLDGKPATVKTQSSDLKTTLKDKNINYEIEFEYAYNLINDVV
jgi:hypothetical protein